MDTFEQSDVNLSYHDNFGKKSGHSLCISAAVSVRISYKIWDSVDSGKQNIMRSNYALSEFDYKKRC